MDNSDWPRDEYDSYDGPMMRLLENGASDLQILSYLDMVDDNMGLEFQRDNTTQFAVRAK